MTTFSPSALTLSAQIAADTMTIEAGAPASVVSISDGTFFGSAASGVSALDGPDARADQSFEIGSQTKMMTALVILQLADEGRIDLDQPLTAYVHPRLTTGVANADIATVRNALEMRTGLQNYTDIERPDGTSMSDIIVANPDEVFGAEEVVAFLNGLPAAGQAGGAYAYSNTDYFYLSEVIETVTGQSLGAVFEGRIFEPLDMHDTYLNDFRNDPQKLSSYLGIDGDLFDVSDLLVDANGEGGVISTTADMTKFLQALLVDQTLASPDNLTVMMDFETGGVDHRGFVFSRGLVSLEFEEVGTFIGFSGGTFGTDSATFLHVESGRIISTAITQSNLDATGAGAMIYAADLANRDEAWAADATGPLLVEGASAADLDFQSGDGEVTIFADDASITLDGSLSQLGSEAFHFADGSRLLIGSQGADVIKAAASGAAVGADNQLLGFGGHDRLVGHTGDDLGHGGRGKDILIGRRGDDELNGGGGKDTLKGNAGDDTLNGDGGADRLIGGGHDDSLSGGGGRDMLIGGDGDDWMDGGRGADMFLFTRTSRDANADVDVIVDFKVGQDALMLRGRSVVETQEFEDRVELTLDRDGDTIVLMGVEDVSDLGLF